MSSSSILSEKFAVTIQKLLIWLKDNDYELKDSDNCNIKWSMDLLNDFNEPGRNKIETFIKKIGKEYLLTKDSNKVLDVKMLVNNFKQNKPKIQRKKKQKETLTSTPKENPNVIVDNTLNTSNTFNVDTLPYFTDDLIEVFGYPEEIKDEDSQYEWKLNVNGYTYSIYDWIENNETFEDKMWYLASTNEDTSEDTKNIKMLYKFINDKIYTNDNESTVINSEDEDNDDDESDTNTSNKLDKALLKELFGEDDSELETEIDLDTIDDDSIDLSNLQLDIDTLF